MITYIDFSWIKTSFVITGIKIDWIQLIYDIISIILSSYVVYKITTKSDYQKEIRKNFERDKQELSRYLDALKCYVDNFNDQPDRTGIKQFIKQSPYRESFDYIVDDKGVMHQIRMVECKIEDTIDKDTVDKHALIKIASELYRLRVEVVKLSLPKGHLKNHRFEHFNQQFH